MSADDYQLQLLSKVIITALVLFEVTSLQQLIMAIHLVENVKYTACLSADDFQVETYIKVIITQRENVCIIV